MPLTSRITMELSGLLSASLDYGSPTSGPEIRQDFPLATGTGAGQADKIWVDQRTLAASATEDLDLTGAQVDAFGATITLARIKGLLIRASAANVNNVVIGAASSNAWATLLNATGTITLRPGAAIMLAAGTADATAYAVTAATGDLLKIANSGAGSSVVYDIAVIGCSA